MQKFPVTSVKLTKFALGLTLAATLAACGGGSDSPAAVTVASTDTSAAVTSTSVAALATATPTVVSFGNGFSGTDGTTTAVTLTGPTTVAFTSAAANPTFAITNDGKTAEGTTTFGSCIFTVGDPSPFPSAHPLGANKVIKVEPCSLTASTKDATANGTTVQRNVVLTFGGTTSDPVKLEVTVKPDGSVLIGNTQVATVTLTTTTGGGN